METLIGQSLGQYEIKEKIGQGGMARVFKAYQPGLDRFVAVKVLSPSLAQEAGFTERFKREAHSAARLHHPHILEVYDFGVYNGYKYLVMRYVEDSRTLRDLIQEGTPLESLVDYIIQVADALNYAHERGVIHRDVKPSNILIDGRWALLADFGLAKMRETSSQLTGTGVGIGTPAYMSPEQASGASLVDHRTDIYALGVILYRILTGSVPHEAPTPLAMLARRCSEPVRPARELNPEVPESIDNVVLRSLATEPDVRYSSATQFAQALQNAQKDPDYREDILATVTDLTAETAMVGKVVDAGVTTGAPEEERTFLSPEVATQRKNVALIAGAAIAGVVIVAVVVIALLAMLLGNGGSAAVSGTPTDTPESAELSAIVTESKVPDTPTPVPPETPLVTAKEDLEVRSGPGDDYELLGYLPESASAEIVSRDQMGRWWQVKSSLGSEGLGWIRAGSEFSGATGTDNLPIALAPPTPTSASVPDTPTPTITPAPDTPTPTATPAPATRTPTPTRVADTLAPTPTPTRLPPTSTREETAASPTATQAPTTPAGQFTLLRPSLTQPTYGSTEFEWRWSGPVESDQGFEVRVWRDGEPAAGVHNAVEDNRDGKVVASGNNTYRLTADITDAYGVQGRSGEYLWTVVLIQISPEYKDLGKQAIPGRLRFEATGGGDDDGGPTQPPD